MSWFFISLVATALFAVSNFIDKILISKYFKGGGVGALAIYSALIGFFILPAPLFFDANFLAPGLFDILLMSCSGVLYLLGIIPYLYALTEDDTSAVVPIFQTIPIFSFILGYVFLRETITSVQFIGMLLIVFGSITISIDMSESKVRFKKKGTLLMLMASVFISFSNLLFKFTGNDYGFLITSYWTYLGYAILGALFFVFVKNYRTQFIFSMKANSLKIISINSLNEVIAIVSKMLQNFATLLAPLALVIAVNGFQPVFVLIYGILLTLFFPHIVSENITKRHIGIKAISITIIVIGALLIA